ncbi:MULTISPECIES: hypothetical protein, partial [unclassified Bradyrhizobium]|uniref:hypothetical protein n=1 Tax=unclassified Bradyrhizobium TaxID=2631580 RepID=UPI001FF7896C
LRPTIIAAIITSPRHRLAILIVARFPSRLSRYIDLSILDSARRPRSRLVQKTFKPTLNETPAPLADRVGIDT